MDIKLNLDDPVSQVGTYYRIVVFLGLGFLAKTKVSRWGNI